MRVLVGLVLSLLALAACQKGEGEGSKATEKAPEKPAAKTEIVVYSGRGEPLVGPLLKRFEEQSGHVVKVRYGDTSSLAALLLEEKEKTPASLFFAQDAGALGALAAAGLLEALPKDVLDAVPGAFRSPEGAWIGVSGRARSLVYSTERVRPEALPKSVLELVDPKWKGKIGWAPTNGSFQAFVTGLRQLHGDEKAEAWLKGILANEPKEYPKNSAIVRAVGAGEIDVGLVNHYYLHRFLAEDPKFPAKNHFFEGGDAGALVNVAGVGLLKGQDAAKKEAALALVRFLLSKDAQAYFAKETHEYPLVAGVQAPEAATPLEALAPPKLDLSSLKDLEGTLALLRKAGALP